MNRYFKSSQTTKERTTDNKLVHSRKVSEVESKSGSKVFTVEQNNKNVASVSTDTTSKTIKGKAILPQKDEFGKFYRFKTIDNNEVKY